MKLVKYRDAGMRTYTYFWTNKGVTISPFFDSEADAQKWMTERVANVIRKGLTTK